jgi:hypothetical protein
MLQHLSTWLFQWTWPEVIGGFVVARERKQKELWEARVVFTFEDAYRNNPVFMTRLCDLFPAIYKQPSGPFSDTGQLREWLHEPLLAEPEYRRALPTSVTYGVQTYLADVSVPSKHLLDGFDPWDYDQGLIPCRAEPGENGRIVAQRYRADAVRRRHLSRLEVLSGRGRRVTAVLVQANMQLFQPGTNDLPCLVLISFDAGPQDVQRLAGRLYDAKRAVPSNDMERYVSRILSDSDAGAQYHRRRRLPDEFTGGLPPIYAADLWIHRPFLRQGYLTPEDRWFPCIAEPGDRGGIELLPFSA